MNYSKSEQFSKHGRRSSPFIFIYLSLFFLIIYLTGPVAVERQNSPSAQIPFEPCPRGNRPSVHNVHVSTGQHEYLLSRFSSRYLFGRTCIRRVDGGVFTYTPPPVGKPDNFLCAFFRDETVSVVRLST